MNTTLKRIIASALLASSLLLTACASDSGDSGSSADTTSAAETTTAATTELTDKVPELDFEGASFRFVTLKSSTTNHQMVYEEQVGDVLKDTMYERTQEMEQRFNIKFAPDNPQSDITGYMRTVVTAGDDAGEVFMPTSTGVFTITGEGLFYDFRDLPYVDLEAEWWFTELNELNNLTDNIYLAYGAMNLGVYDFLNVTLFNKNMIKSYNLDEPYQLVWDGKWTFDKMAEMARTVVSDADGDGTVSMNDIFGYAGRSNSLATNFLSSAKLRTVEVDADGIPYLVTDNDKIIEVFEKAVNLFYENGFWYSKTSTANNYYDEFPFFENDQALFADRSFFSVSKLRDMESDFGVIPFPKYDEAQDGYGVMFEAGSRISVIPTTITKPDMVGAVLEAMNFYSLKNVVPAYYEVSLKQKYARDEESIRMLDLITDSVFHDLGNTVFSSQVKDGIYRSLFSANSIDLASKYETQLTKFNEQLAKAMTD